MSFSRSIICVYILYYCRSLYIHVLHVLGIFTTGLQGIFSTPPPAPPPIVCGSANPALDVRAVVLVGSPPLGCGGGNELWQTWETFTPCIGDMKNKFLQNDFPFDRRRPPKRRVHVCACIGHSSKNRNPPHSSDEQQLQMMNHASPQSIHVSGHNFLPQMVLLLERLPTPRFP